MIIFIHDKVSGRDPEKTMEATFRSTATSSIPKPLTADMVIRSLCWEGDGDDYGNDDRDTASSSSSSSSY